ncbi:MAG: hypothetical protein HXY21_12845 [Parvularculaceae bacterium]|nr:hypothetical protein [Parvularculaceae bacterium]
MVWPFNFLTEIRKMIDGRRPLESRAENAAEGCSSQDMIVWSADDEPVKAGRQPVAIFV